MLHSSQVQDYADVLLWGLKTARTARYQKGDIVLLRFDKEALPVAEALQKKLLQAGMQPLARMNSTPLMDVQFYEEAGPKQLVFIAPGEKELCESLNGAIYLYAPESLTHLSHIDPSRIGKAAVARKGLRGILDQREMAGDFGWTLGMVPTLELARQAKTSLATYTRHWLKACYLDTADPVGQWKELHRRASALKKWLNSLEPVRFHVTSARTDLIITPGAQRRWIGVSGHNIPSFEVFLSPDWRGTEGTYYADQPSFRSGNYVKGVTLTFKKGKVVASEAEEGAEFLKKQLTMDAGACRLGEFSLTDRRFSPINRFMANTLFDENFGGRYGNCHVAVGASYADTFSADAKTLTPQLKESLGFNDSALHWDLVNTEKKTVTATLASGNEIVIYKDGEFLGL